MYKAIVAVVLSLACISSTYCGDGGKGNVSSTGTYTTLSGFGAWQSNRSIVTNSANGNMHVILNASDDSMNIVRVTKYAFSSNGGMTWNNFGNVRVPSRRSGFPTLDIVQGANPGLPVIGNHSVVGANLQSTVFVDSPEGSGAFSELNAPPFISSGNDEPIAPFVVGASDGSIVLLATRSTAGTVHVTRTADFSSWNAWTTLAGATRARGLVAGPSGRVAALTLSATNELQLWVSTNNGQTWAAVPQIIAPSPIIIEGDTFQINGSCDLVYKSNNLCVVFPMWKKVNDTTFTKASIGYWSAATGIKFAVRWDALPNVPPTIIRCDGLRVPLGEPSIGLAGSYLAVAFQAVVTPPLPGDTLRNDIFMVSSSNGGLAWGRPFNLTNSYALDEYSPSVSKWMPLLNPRMIWLERTNPCSNVRVRQVFLYLIIDEINPSNVQQPTEFRLGQNYPNPFNPSTTLSFVIGHSSFVILKVYDVLGREVATLVNEVKEAGNYKFTWNAEGLASGVYFYRLTAGEFFDTKKFLIVR